MIINDKSQKQGKNKGKNEVKKKSRSVFRVHFVKVEQNKTIKQFAF